MAALIEIINNDVQFGERAVPATRLAGTGTRDREGGP
jgi:hypothetical protein